MEIHDLLVALGAGMIAYGTIRFVDRVCHRVTRARQRADLLVMTDMWLNPDLVHHPYDTHHDIDLRAVRRYPRILWWDSDRPVPLTRRRP